MEPQTERQTKEWAYAGVRCLKDARLVDQWYPDSGKSDQVVWFEHTNLRYVIGGLYTLNVSRQKNGHTRCYGYPRYTHKELDPRVLDWTTADDLARLEREHLRDRHNNWANDALNEALKPVQGLIEAQRTY